MGAPMRRASPRKGHVLRSTTWGPHRTARSVRRRPPTCCPRTPSRRVILAAGGGCFAATKVYETKGITLTGDHLKGTTHARRRHRLYRPHVDRQGLSRRIQRHHAAGAGRSCDKSCCRPRRGRLRRGRGCGLWRGPATGLHRHQYRPPVRDPRRPVRNRGGYVSRPAMRQRHDGHRHGGETGYRRRAADRRRRWR